MSYDDFKEFSIDKINDATSCGNDINISYSTVNRLTLDVNVPSPTGMVFTNPYGHISLSWQPPGDYINSPEKYLGFIVIRKEGLQAPTSLSDGQIVYIGRNTFFGDFPNNDLLNTGNQLFSDPGLQKANYAYSVFTISREFSYSKPALGTIFNYDNAGTQVATITMNAAQISGNIIKNAGKSYGDAFNLTVNNPELVSIKEVLGGPDLVSNFFLSLQGSVEKSTCIESDPIEIKNIKPNTIYQIIFWTRSSYNPNEIKGATDNAVNAFSGIFEVISDDFNLYQHSQLLHNEDLSETQACTCDDLKEREPAYDFEPNVSFKYLGSALNGVLRRVGMTFITGSIKDSSPNNLYGANGGNPTQRLNTTTASGSVKFRFSLPKIDSETFGTNVSSVTAEIGSVLFQEGIKGDQNLFSKIVQQKPLNLLLNNNFSFDIATSGVNVNINDGFNSDAITNSATTNWIINNGAFSYTKNNNYYYATLTPTCSESSMLQQDIWYMNINKNQKYTVTFEANLYPPDAQQQICNQTKYMCPETDKGGGPKALSNLSINILDSTKNPVGFFDNATTPLSANLSATEYYCTKISNQEVQSLKDKENLETMDCSYPTNCEKTEGWKKFSYTFTVQRNLSPSLQFSVDKNVSNGVSWGIRNVSLAPTEVTTDIGQEGFDVPPPIPTVPSTTSGVYTDSSKVPNIQTWDFSTPASKDQKILDWLSRLNNATLDENGRYVGGIFCLDQKGSSYENLSVVQDNGTQVLCLTAKAKNPDPKKPNINAPTGACLLTSEYYATGVFDLYVKVTNVKKDGKNLPQGTDPVGCCFADWLFHYIDYNNTFASQAVFQPDTKRNAEIDIEISANCPKGNDNYNYSVGRLNGWGGVSGGTGGNFEMHTKMPCDANGKPINLSDGLYHKLTIVLNTGKDNVKATDRENTRSPGYIKWYIDDNFWGGGWLGANYGIDNIPHTAMRFVFGPWFPTGWAGCVCPSDSKTIGCDASLCSFTNDNFIWDSADFFLKKASYTPLYSNGKEDQSNYMVSPVTNGSTGKPNTQVGEPPNRDRYLPASNPYVHFDPTCQFSPPVDPS